MGGVEEGFLLKWYWPLQVIVNIPIRLLEEYYQSWMAKFDLCPVLTIRTDDLDFVHRTKHLEIIIQRIHEKLAGKEEVQF